MRVLSLDTSTARGNVALLEGGEAVVELRTRTLDTHSARLMGAIDFVLKSAGWDFADLDLVAAGIGPGSFTGIRIGVATALGLAQSSALPFAGISRLDALAHEYRFLEGRIAVLFDAQRSQVYFAEYAAAGGRVRRIAKPVLAYPAELAARLKRGQVFLLGDGAPRYARILGASKTGRPRLVGADLWPAAGIGRLAAIRKRSWRRGPFLHAEPLYIRPPDALRRRSIDKS